MLRASAAVLADGRTVALAITLLASVSITVAQAAHPSRLAHDLKRDLGALRAQLELIDPWERDAERQTVDSNADVGDGSPSFQRHSMAAVVGAANRRLAHLLDRYREEGSDARVRTAEALRVANAGSAAPDRPAGARRRSGRGGGGARAHRGVAGPLGA